MSGHLVNSKKVVLVQPPVEDFYLTLKRTMPVGLASIAAVLKKNGYEPHIIDGLATRKQKPIPKPEHFNYLDQYYSQKDISLFSLFHSFRHFGYSYGHIGKLVREHRPFLVGISSLFTAYAGQSLKTAEVIKTFLPDCRIVLGGHHPTHFPKKVLEHPAVDFVLRGEGETSMIRLCNALINNKKDLSDIPGIAYKTDRKELLITPPSWIDDLSTQPEPEHDLINHQFYQRHKRHTATVVTSRGCPMPCSYCSVSRTSGHGSFRLRRVDSVLKELVSQFAKRDIGFIDFEDENLCFDKNWFFSLFSALHPLIKDKNIEIRAMNGLYPPALDDQIVNMMASCGFKTLNLSLGSACPDQLKKFNRPVMIQAFEEALDLAQKYNLTAVSYIIAGAPGQSAQTSIDDLIFLAAKKTLIGLSIYYPAPGSRDYTEWESKKILPASFDLMRSAALPFDDTTTRLQSVTLLRLSRIINFIKHVMDTEGVLLKAEPVTRPEMPSDRYEGSKHLVSAFLSDGRIRGITPNGKIFTCPADESLTAEFLKKLEGKPVSAVNKDLIYQLR